MFLQFRCGVFFFLSLVVMQACDESQDSKLLSETVPDSAMLHRVETGTTFVHLFEWKWSDIAKECRTFLGPAGYSAVQISPPSEHAIVNANDQVDAYPWYQRYQPVSYRLDSRSGSREELAEMVASCNEAGVQVYADAVINHTTGVVSNQEVRRGSAGSEYSTYRYPEYSFEDFHQCGTKGHDIENYYDRYQVQNCELVNLADLKTETPSVQDKISTYLADLMSLGIAGFRIDAAKHMDVNDILAILEQTEEKAGRKPYIFQEVIDQSNEPIRASEYIRNGNQVTEFRYGADLGRIFLRGKLSWFRNKSPFGEAWGYLPSDSAVVFTDNHDNQRGHGGGGLVLSHKTPRLYTLANIFMLAWPYGYPKVMSSYEFDHPDQSPPHVSGVSKDVHGAKGLNCGKGEWICEHRWPAVANMVQFRRKTMGAPVENWSSNDNNFIAFSRGDLGFVAINRENVRVSLNLPTGLTEGEYCNLLKNDCSERYQVEMDGSMWLELEPMSALVLIRSETPSTHRR